MFDYAAFLVALVLYVPRLTLFWIYRALLFISKPGSLYILPALLAGLFYWQYDFIIRSLPFYWWVNEVILVYFPHYPYLEPYWYLGFFWFCFTFVLYLLTGGRFQILGTVLSSLPQMRRPFPPALRLRLVERKIRPASVALAVPALKRRRRGKRAPDVAAGLSEPLQRLLAPPTAPLPVSTPIEPQTAPEAPETAFPLQDQLPEAEKSVPVPSKPAKEAVKARPSRKPPPPPLPPKASHDGQKDQP
ncbi:hypothetical protein [Thalassococcus sp. S3]|uniref:hypothetical protein n=1 Tax=Thalassococcus sp. S3 TaxID=2017482 RepID=UPI00102BD31F|nr:hypothetical protein [Thalassococcus sp. S3]